MPYGTRTPSESSGVAAAYVTCSRGSLPALPAHSEGLISFAWRSGIGLSKECSGATLRMRPDGLSTGNAGGPRWALVQLSLQRATMDSSEVGPVEARDHIRTSKSGVRHNRDTVGRD